VIPAIDSSLGGLRFRHVRRPALFFGAETRMIERHYGREKSMIGGPPTSRVGQRRCRDGWRWNPRAFAVSR
jgi:hypothetical protein